MDFIVKELYKIIIIITTQGCDRRPLHLSAKQLIMPEDLTNSISFGSSIHFNTSLIGDFYFLSRSRNWTPKYPNFVLLRSGHSSSTYCENSSGSGPLAGPLPLLFSLCSIAKFVVSTIPLSCS